ncbi:Pirin-like protein [Hyaloraphidium curvatum]|nr:Pirin-like protein [Hyaloraphidium curvatum]
MAELLSPVLKDLGGGFTVRRLLPSVSRKAVGPYVFFDHFGPVEAAPGDNHDVRPHPHIGLATVTYVYEGAMMHRDSTGAVQRVEPGAINWMISGRGVVHSERTPEDLKGVDGRRSHGLQLWVGLPDEAEEEAPSFHHAPAGALPEVKVGGATVRVLLGSAFGETSPVPVRSPIIYLDMALPDGQGITLPQAEERAVYVVQGKAAIDGKEIPPFSMFVLAPGSSPTLSAVDGDARAVLVGGAPLGHRFLWWNFVSSRRERIIKAADDWAQGRFDPVPGETEFIPLPAGGVPL